MKHRWIVLCAATAACVGGCYPWGMDERHARNLQTAAAHSINHIRVQQMLAGEKGMVDQDRDGIPEFPLLGELAGEIVPRGAPRNIPWGEPFLPSGYRTGGARGEGFAERNGYLFRIYLPASPDTAGDDKTLGGTPEEPGPPVRSDVIHLQERHVAIYAWPVQGGSSPRTRIAFFTNESGTLYRQVGTPYVGKDHPPPAEAAYSGHVFTSPIDTSRWQPLSPPRTQTTSRQGEGRP